MEDNTLKEKIVEIERQGELKQDDFHKTYWVKDISQLSWRNHDIASAAKALGYDVGDKINYKITLEPKA